jgi:signal transduction histidine kinase
MSAATSKASPAGEVRTPRRQHEGLGFRILSITVFMTTASIFVLALAQTEVNLIRIQILGWVLLVGLTSLVPVPTGRGAELSMDLPVLLAAAIVFQPAVAGAIAFLGAVDPREWKREVSLWMSVYNRAQIALSVIAASLAFHFLGGRVGLWPWTALAGLIALGVDSLVNYSLVAAASTVKLGRSFKESLKAMRFGEPRVFIPTYLSFGFLGVLAAEAYESIGLVGVLAFVGPVLLAREAFIYRTQLESFARSLGIRGAALQKVDLQIAEERRDEREVLAGEIHDEVLPPLFKVHLMGQVLRRDLESGRLLDLDEDLPELLRATEFAQDAIRSVLRNLRASSLGPSGLNSTLELLVRSVEAETNAAVRLEIEDVGGTPLVQLLLYRLAREALRNSVKHSSAQNITVRLWHEDDLIRMIVEDDGVGFDPERVDPDAHFGLQLMRERVTAFGGDIAIESQPGRGTTIFVVLTSDPL